MGHRQLVVLRGQGPALRERAVALVRRCRPHESKLGWFGSSVPEPVRAHVEHLSRKGLRRSLGQTFDGLVFDASEGLDAIRFWIRRLREDPAACRAAFDTFVAAHTA